MPEDQKSGFSEAVETGASAAHTICGAIKTGKAISLSLIHISEPTRH